jgi:hypothetical protein
VQPAAFIRKRAYISSNAGPLAVKDEDIRHHERSNAAGPAIAVEKLHFEVIRGKKLDDGTHVPDLWFSIAIQHRHDVEQLGLA